MAIVVEVGRDQMQPIRDGDKHALVIRGIHDIPVLHPLALQATGGEEIELFVESVYFKPVGTLTQGDAMKAGYRGRMPSENGADPGERPEDALVTALLHKHGDMNPEELVTVVTFRLPTYADRLVQAREAREIPDAAV